MLLQGTLFQWYPSKHHEIPKKSGRDISWKNGPAVEKAVGPCTFKNALKTMVDNKDASLTTIKFICVNIIYNSHFTDINIFIDYSLILGAS